MSKKWNMPEAQTLLDEFSKRVPPRPERPPTLMEISGYPHYENVCSNILAFFFDPDKPHGLGTLFLDALVRAGGIGEHGREIGGNIQIRREESTQAGNRIDMLIQSDSHAILIENKIFHEISNPFEDYIKHVEKHYEHLKNHLFILSLKPGGDMGRFKNITYEQLFAEIRSLLGYRVSRADTRYLTFMFDFLNTVDGLWEGAIVNEKLACFLATDDNLEKAKHFFKEIDTFKNELRGEVTRLGDQIQVDGIQQQGKWREKHGLADILWLKVDCPLFGNIVLNAIIDPDGWRFEVFLANEPPDPDTLEKLKSLLQELGIEFEDKYRIPLQERFQYTEELSKVAAFVRDLVTKFKHSSVSAA